MRLRALNDEGLKAFRRFLQGAGEKGARVPDAEINLLVWPATSKEIAGAPELEPLPHHVNRFEIARYLHERFASLDQDVIEGEDGQGNPGLWAAASLFYFDLLTPDYREGGRVLADNCYIPGLDTEMAGVRYFRHRLAGAYRLYRLHQAASEPLLLSAPGVQDALFATITNSVFYTETSCVVEAINLLYFDSRNHRLKPGYNAKDKPGTLARLLTVIDQLDLTYDLQGISGEKLLQQLPEEFAAWH